MAYADLANRAARRESFHASSRAGIGLHPVAGAYAAAAGPDRVLPGVVMAERILAIESSCDETAAAVVEDGARVLSSAVASQMDVHGKYGGVVPELASREHLRAIVPVTREVLAAAGGLKTIDAIAVTEGPGLIGSLLVGITYAKALCLASSLPLIAVNHLEGHIHAVVLEARLAGAGIDFPAVALIASGGHSHFFEVSSDFQYRLLGRTRDDAAGEA